MLGVTGCEGVAEGAAVVWTIKPDMLHGLTNIASEVEWGGVVQGGTGGKGDGIGVRARFSHHLQSSRESNSPRS